VPRSDAGVLTGAVDLVSVFAYTSKYSYLRKEALTPPPVDTTAHVDEDHLVHLTTWARHERDKEVTPATATVKLPRHGPLTNTGDYGLYTPINTAAEPGQTGRQVSIPTDDPAARGLRLHPLAPTESAHGASADLIRLIYELLDAHRDTADLAGGLGPDERWAAHLEYLRALQRMGRRALAEMSVEGRTRGPSQLPRSWNRSAPRGAGGEEQVV
jgi:hypothetical protein